MIRMPAARMQQNKVLNSGGAPAWTKVLYATQWNSIPNIKESRTMRGYLTRFPARVGSNPLKTIRLCFSSIFLSSASTGLANDLGNNINIQKFMIEYNGISYPVTFGGLRTKTLLSTDAHIYADDIDVQTAFGVPSLAVDTQFWVKGDCTLDLAADSMPACAPRGISHTVGSQVYFYKIAAEGGITTVSDTDALGTYTLTGGVNGTDYVARTSGWTPFVLGVHTVQSDAWVASGDSITAGTGDSGTNTSGLGWFQRLMGMFTKKMASGNIAVHGSTRLAGVNDPRITKFYEYATLGVINKGINDFGAGGSGITVATLVAGNTAIMNNMKASGVRAVGVCELVPRTNSTDSWVTEANQTPLTGWDTTSSFGYIYNQQLPLPGFEFKITYTTIRGIVSQFNWFPNCAFDTTHPNATGNTTMATEALPICQPFILY